MAGVSWTHGGWHEDQSHTVAPEVSHLSTSRTESGSRHSSTSWHTSLVCSLPARGSRTGRGSRGCRTRARPFLAPLHTAETSQSGHPDTTNCPLLLLRTIQLPLPACSKGLISTSPQDKGCCCGRIHAGPSSLLAEPPWGSFGPSLGSCQEPSCPGRQMPFRSWSSAGNQPSLPSLSISHPNSSAQVKPAPFPHSS